MQKILQMQFYYAVEAPNHVNVNEVLVRPTTQER